MKYALVTGASRGIGKAVALRLAAAGWPVVINFLSNKDAAQQVADEIAILPYVGPYFAYGISGKYKIQNGNIVEKRGSYNYFNHWDMGFKIGCGAEYNKLYAELGYQIGVSNLAKENPADEKSHTSAIYFNVGVNF